ncbi:MAG: WecB/TagA/CpsF family glycosyltransferase [Pseudomonadota bacterium]
MQHSLDNSFRFITESELSNRLDTVRDWPTVQLFGHTLACASRSAMSRHIVARVNSGQRSTINFVNAHCVNVAKADPAYRTALNTSDLLLPDGVGVEIAAKMTGQELGENLNGTDLFPELCREAQEEGVGIFLLGGEPGIAHGAANWAAENYPALRIAGTHHGFFNREEEDALIKRINGSFAGIVLVGMGVPHQETWIARNRHRINAPVVMGVGGLFDYYSGRIARAPKIVRAMKSEWMWRLAMEPRRMAKRYLLGNAEFLAHALIEAARQTGVLDAANEIAKRALDIAVSSMAILALLPIFLATALAIRLEDSGPVFFRQTRVGEDGTAFSMIKFRSMYRDSEERRAALLAQSDRAGTSFKMKKDPRITRTGRFIRRFSIDELPQLFNVLGGSMSLVGPRPALPSEVSEYKSAQWDRLKGKPGITCTWQVRGRAEIPFERQAIMDRAYLKRTNLWVDLKLLLCTPGAVLSGRGAY